MRKKNEMSTTYAQVEKYIGINGRLLRASKSQEARYYCNFKTRFQFAHPFRSTFDQSSPIHFTAL